MSNQAEAVALEHLCKHGLELIEQNYLTKMGEIDIIIHIRSICNLKLNSYNPLFSQFQSNNTYKV